MSDAIACRECTRMYFPPSLPDKCPGCGARRVDYQDSEQNLWIQLGNADA